MAAYGFLPVPMAAQVGVPSLSVTKVSLFTVFPHSVSPSIAMYSVPALAQVGVPSLSVTKVSPFTVFPHPGLPKYPASILIAAQVDVWGRRQYNYIFFGCCFSSIFSILGSRKNVFPQLGLPKGVLTGCPNRIGALCRAPNGVGSPGNRSSGRFPGCLGPVPQVPWVS